MKINEIKEAQVWLSAVGHEGVIYSGACFIEQDPPCEECSGRTIRKISLISMDRLERVFIEQIIDAQDEPIPVHIHWDENKRIAAWSDVVHKNEVFVSECVVVKESRSDLKQAAQELAGRSINHQVEPDPEPVAPVEEPDEKPTIDTCPVCGWIHDEDLTRFDDPRDGKRKCTIRPSTANGRYKLIVELHKAQEKEGGGKKDVSTRTVLENVFTGRTQDNEKITNTFASILGDKYNTIYICTDKTYGRGRIRRPEELEKEKQEEQPEEKTKQPHKPRKKTGK